MFAIVFMLLSAAALMAQPWEYSTVELIPQPRMANWSQVHVLPVPDGQTAVASGQWDWPPVAMYDSLGEQLWCNCGEGIYIEESFPSAMDLVAKPGGFVALYYHPFLNDHGRTRAYGWLFVTGSLYQTTMLGDTTSAFRAVHDGTKSYFLCRYINNTHNYFVSAVSDTGTEWMLPLHGDFWVDIPTDFCVAKGVGVSYCGINDAMETRNLALRTIGFDGNDLGRWMLYPDSIGDQVKACTDNVLGCWVIGVPDSDQTNDVLYLFYSADHSYHQIPLGMTLPPIEQGAVPTLHAIPFGEGILIAGQATLESGEECLFTLTYSSDGVAGVGTILGYTQMLDIAGDGLNNYTAAVRVNAESEIELLRAHSLVSSVDDPIFEPSSFTLSAYPNPFNPQTTIAFDLPKAGDVSLKLFDVLGREVATLLNKRMNAGSHTLSYDAAALSSGVYFVKLNTTEFEATHKLLLLK